MAEFDHYTSRKLRVGATTYKLNLSCNATGGDLDVLTWGPDGPQEDKGIGLSVSFVSWTGMKAFADFASTMYGIDVWAHVQEMGAAVGVDTTPR